MKKLLAIIVFSLMGVFSFLLAPAVHAHYRDFPNHNAQFHPQHPDYYDGNQRLKLKKRADIERASASNLHYDEYARDYYRCDWTYNKNLGTWVCNKSYSQSAHHPADVCPFGYTRHPIQNHCVRVRVPANAHLNSQGNGWQCNSGYHLNSAGTGCDRNRAVHTYEPETEYEVTQYVYYYGDELPQTGPGINWTLLVGSLGTLVWFITKDSLR